MLTYTTSKTQEDLQGILDLQRNNLPDVLSSEEIKTQGFVTVRHRLEDLQKMNALEQSVIAKDGEQVVAYLIAMTEKSKADIPQLIPMFDLFGQIHYKGKIVADFQYMVVGQVCIRKDYRGQGVLDACYATYRSCFQHKYDFAITEIDLTNTRSGKAHQRIGFEEIHRYQAPSDGAQWSVVAWDWSDKPGE